jgi:hypothetical protein
VNAATFSGSVAYYSTAGLGAIYFTDSFTATSVTWSSNFIVFTGFNSLMTLGLKNPEVGVTMTIDSVSHDLIKYTIAGGVAAATWSLYLPTVASAECQTVVGVTGWAWDGNTKIITVTQDTYPLQVTIGLTWGGGGGGGGGEGINDIDGDGIPNETDPDMDGDGLLNGADIDIDGDGVANPMDPDMDHDQDPNEYDPDMDGDGYPNGNDVDMDGDQVPNSVDSDVDGDGVPNPSDSDIDGDKIPNDVDPDIDGDGLINANDPTPNGVVPSSLPEWVPAFLQPAFTWVQQNATMAAFIGFGGILVFLGSKPRKKQRRGLESVFKEKKRR